MVQHFLLQSKLRLVKPPFISERMAQLLIAVSNFVTQQICPYYVVEVWIHQEVTLRPQIPQQTLQIQQLTFYVNGKRVQVTLMEMELLL